MVANELTDRVTLHFENVQAPYNLLIMIEALATSPDMTFGTATDVVQFVRSSYDYLDPKNESVTMALQLGLLHRIDSGLQLTPLGLAISACRPGVREDLLHFLLHSSNRIDTGGLGRSWAYRTFCNRLWDAEQAVLSRDAISRFTEEILSDAPEVFPNAASFSFGRKSLNGMRLWLCALDPPVISGKDVFERRGVCSRELLLLAVAAVARADFTQLDTELLLSPERRRAICQICLLEPTSLDRRLDAMLPTFPSYISPGTRTGAYGRFVRLHAFPTIEQVADPSSFDRR